MFKASLASKIAHTSIIPALGNKDLRLLQDFILNEKTVLISLQRLATDMNKSCESMNSWGLGEGDDLGDVLSHATRMLAHVATALTQLSNHENSIRAHLKAIRSREERLDDSKKRRKALGSKSEAAEKKLQRMSVEHKNLHSQTELLTRLRDEMRSLDAEILNDEASVGDFKRVATRNFMNLKFGGLLEFAEKVTIVGELGKLLIEEIPKDVTPPGHPRAFYGGHEKTQQLAAEVQRCVAEVTFTPTAEVGAMGHMSARPSEEDGGFQPPVGADSRFVPGSGADYAPSPTAQPMYGASEFGEETARYGQRPPPGSQPVGSSRPIDDGERYGVSQFSTFPSAQRRETRDTSFAASIQDALDHNSQVTSFDVRSGQSNIPPGPPPTLYIPPQGAPQPAQFEQQSSQLEPSRTSWVSHHEDDLALNAAAARELAQEFDSSVSLSVDNAPIPDPSYSLSQAPVVRIPPPSMYTTPAQSFSEQQSPSGAGKINVAAFKKRTGPLAARPPPPPSENNDAHLSPRSVHGNADAHGALPPYDDGAATADYPNPYAAPVYAPPPSQAYAIDYANAHATQQGGNVAHDPAYEYNSYAAGAHGVQDAHQDPRAAYVGSPLDADFGSIGPTRINNADGYAQGRYATNLEH